MRARCCLERGVVEDQRHIRSRPVGRRCQDARRGRARQPRLARAHRTAGHGSGGRRARPSGSTRTSRCSARCPTTPTPEDWDALREPGRRGRARVPRPGRDRRSRRAGRSVFRAEGTQMAARPPVDRRAADRSARDRAARRGRRCPRSWSSSSARRPGPFLPRTIELGTYLGIRDDGRARRDWPGRACTSRAAPRSARCAPTTPTAAAASRRSSSAARRRDPRPGRARLPPRGQRQHARRSGSTSRSASPPAARWTSRSSAARRRQLEQVAQRLRGAVPLAVRGADGVGQPAGRVVELHDLGESGPPMS